MSGITEQVISEVRGDGLSPGSFQLKLSPTYQPASEGQGNGVFLMTTLFIGYIMYNLPAAAAIVMISSTEGRNEANIWVLSRSMGMKEIPWLISFLIIMTIGTVFFGSLFCIFVKFFIVSKSSFSLLLVSSLAYTYGTLFQFIFLAVAFGTIGIIIFAVALLVQFLVTAVFGFITMIPSSISAPMGLICPMMSYANILRCMLLL